MRSTATVQRIGTSANPAIHFFRDASGAIGNTRSFESSGTRQRDRRHRAAPQGARGQPGPAGHRSRRRQPYPHRRRDGPPGRGRLGREAVPGRVVDQPHVLAHATVGYEWNGESTLAGDPVAGTKAKLPDQLTYSGGVAVAVTGNLTLAADVIGRRIIDGRRLVPKTFTALDGRTTFPDISFVVASENEISGAVGFKFNPKGRLLIDANLLFSLNDHGLRDTLTPLIGLEYGF